MNYSEEKLTEELQKLTESEKQPSYAAQTPPKEISLEELSTEASDEIIAFVQKSKEYSSRTQGVCIGSY